MKGLRKIAGVIPRGGRDCRVHTRPVRGGSDIDLPVEAFQTWSDQVVNSMPLARVAFRGRPGEAPSLSPPAPPAGFRGIPSNVAVIE